MHTNNVWCGRGRLTYDPKEIKIENNKKAQFTIAINNKRRTKDEQYIEDTEFLNCEVWDSAADYVLSKYKKGQELEIIGTLKSYQATYYNETGQPINIARNYVRVNSFSPLRGPKGEEDESQRGNRDSEILR